MSQSSLVQDTPLQAVRREVGLLRSVRFVPAVVFSGSLALLAVSLWLTPNPLGYGTHQQLGLPPCAAQQFTGIPCPTCGMTTAFSFAAHGQLRSAFLAQPAGAVLALCNAMLLLVSGYCLALGVSMRPLGRLITPALLVVLGVLVGLAWIYKIVLPSPLG